MATGVVSISVSSANVSWSKSYTETGGGFQSHDLALPAGKAGTLTTRTDNDTAVLTLGAGHGLTDETVAVAWDGGKRTGMSITAHDSTTITVDGGSGDSLPIATTAVIVGKAVTAPDVNFDGDEASFLLVKCASRSFVDFLDADSASLFSREIAANFGGYYWAESSDVTRPITGNEVSSVVAYNLTTTADTLTVVAITTT